MVEQRQRDRELRPRHEPARDLVAWVEVEDRAAVEGELVRVAGQTAGVGLAVHGQRGADGVAQGARREDEPLLRHVVPVVDVDGGLVRAVVVAEHRRRRRGRRRHDHHRAGRHDRPPHYASPGAGAPGVCPMYPPVGRLPTRGTPGRSRGPGVRGLLVELARRYSNRPTLLADLSRTWHELQHELVSPTVDDTLTPRSVEHPESTRRKRSHLTDADVQGLLMQPITSLWRSAGIRPNSGRLGSVCLTAAIAAERPVGSDTGGDGEQGFSVPDVTRVVRTRYCCRGAAPPSPHGHRAAGRLIRTPANQAAAQGRWAGTREDCGRYLSQTRRHTTNSPTEWMRWGCSGFGPAGGFVLLAPPAVF